MRLALGFLLSLGLLFTALPAETQEPGFKLIVNARLSTEELPAKEVAKVFMKKTTTWPSGLRITPVDLRVDHPTREAFSQAILGKGARPIERRWQTLIFAGTEVPPLQLGDETEVVSFVKKNAGAVGYVASSLSLPPEVKELEVET